jgi:hypothetical protein
VRIRKTTSAQLRSPAIRRAVYGTTTSLARNFTSLFLAATLHIHVMRNASFGINVTNCYAYNHLIPLTGIGRNGASEAVCLATPDA